MVRVAFCFTAAINSIKEWNMTEGHKTRIEITAVRIFNKCICLCVRLQLYLYLFLYFHWISICLCFIIVFVSSSFAGAPENWHLLGCSTGKNKTEVLLIEFQTEMDVEQRERSKISVFLFVVQKFWSDKVGLLNIWMLFGFASGTVQCTMYIV